VFITHLYNRMLMIIRIILILTSHGLFILILTSHGFFMKSVAFNGFDFSSFSCMLNYRYSLSFNFGN
jgi:hypothetical protein